MRSFWYETHWSIMTTQFLGKSLMGIVCHSQPVTAKESIFFFVVKDIFRLCYKMTYNTEIMQHLMQTLTWFFTTDTNTTVFAVITRPQVGIVFSDVSTWSVSWILEATREQVEQPSINKREGSVASGWPGWTMSRGPEA